MVAFLDACASIKVPLGLKVQGLGKFTAVVPKMFTRTR